MTTSTQDPRGKMTITETMEQMLSSAKFADVTFKFGTNWEKLHGHRNILSMRSPVFEAMLYGPLSGEAGCEINIEDTDHETFSTFLRFLYTDDIDLEGESVLKILYLANKYHLEILEERCSDFLKSNINVENVCTIHDHAVIFGQSELKKKCFDFIIDNNEDVLSSENFVEISKETLKNILSEDSLSANEKLVFDAAIRWAKEQCKKNKIEDSSQNIREQLGDVFQCIRFPLMPVKTFANEICPTQLLTTEEENLLFRHMTSETLVAGYLTRVRQGKYRAVSLDPAQELPYQSQFQYQQCYGYQDPYIRAAETELSLTAAQPVKLHSVACRNLEFVSNVQSVSVMSEMTKDEVEFEAEDNKIVFNHPITINDTTRLVFSINQMQILNSQQVQTMTIMDSTIDVNFNASIFDQIIFLLRQ